MWEKELASMMKAALDAEKIIKEVYSEPFAVEIKSDNSPVTKADKGADALIRQELHSSFPTYALLTEESKDDKSRLANDLVFIVDPVDGTKEFVSKNDEFCTNIGLAYKHELVAGVINVPMKNVMFYAIKGQGAFKLVKGGQPERIHVSDRSLTNLRVLTSISFCTAEEKEWIKKHKASFSETMAIGAALKFCLMAEGKAELFYRMGGSTKEWDTAAGEIILKEAGGIMIKPDGTTYQYNRDDVYNHEGYIMANRQENLLL